MRSVIVFISFLLFSFFNVEAQELKCNLIVDNSVIKSTGIESSIDKSFFTDMQTNFSNFLNTTSWTGEEYRQNERIKCNIVITIREVPELGTYKATLQLQTIRPIYGTSYESTLLNFVDQEFEFTYQQGEPLNYSESSFTTNIVSLLSFYANLIIAFDFDSFKKMGGNPYFLRCQTIAAYSENEGTPGWSGFTGSANSRYWMSENGNNQQFQEFREAVYDYHRMGMDMLTTDEVAARENIMKAIEKFEKLHIVKPRSLILRSFLNAKSDEIVKVLQKCTTPEKRKMIGILTKIDPTNTESYNKIMENPE